jgi:predicted nuclease of predicted toxin-antitoxin system
VKFFLDHDVPAEIARVLRQEGHEVIELRQVLPVHASDRDVFGYASENDLTIITCNRDDFLRLAGGEANPGLVILVRRRSRHAECANLLALLSRTGDAGLRNNINFA